MERWTKQFGKAATQTNLVTFLLIIGWIAGCINAAYLGLRALWPTPLAGGSQTRLAGLATYLGYAGQIAWMLAKIGRFGRYTPLVFPASLLFFLFVFARSTVATFFTRRVTWRGRAIDTAHR